MTKQDVVKLRDVRKRRGLTLKDLSEQSDLSISQLSRLESGKARLTIDTALKLSGILGTPVVSFLSSHEKKNAGRRSITRSSKGTMHDNRPGILFEVLCDELKHKQSFYWKVTIFARSIEETMGMNAHTGEEFISVLSGCLELHSAHYDPILLQAGDSIVFDGEMEHGYVCASDKPAIVIMTNTLPDHSSI